MTPAPGARYALPASALSCGASGMTGWAFTHSVQLLREWTFHQNGLKSQRHPVHVSPCARTQAARSHPAARVAGLQLVLWKQRSGGNCPTLAGPLSHDRSCPRGQEWKDTGPHGRPAATAVAHVGEGSTRVLALLGLPFNKSLLRPGHFLLEQPFLGHC